MIAPRPQDETLRLETLRDYHILDTAAEPAYDSLARLATQVCAAPIAVVTLVDRDRQWFKARIDVDPIELPRDSAFCAYTILGERVLIIRDATTDDRFAACPLVTGPTRVRFYAGAPLTMSNGQRIGTLAVMDIRARDLAPDQNDGLAALAHQVVAQLELRKVFDDGHRLRREGHERFRLLARATNDAVWDWELTTNALWWSEGLRMLFGMPPDVVPTIEDWTARIHPDDRQRIEHSLYGAIRSGVAHWFDEYRFRCHDGRHADILDRGYVIHRDGKPARMIGAVLDVSERRRLEYQLRQAQKMEALGQLSGGVAHDFNNLLTVIQVNASMIARAPGESAVREHANDIVHACDRAAALTRQLLMVSRKQVMHRQLVDVNEVIRNMTRMLQRTLGDKITLVTQCSSQLSLVKADAGMLERVLLNLTVNARDAMPDGGQLTIATGEKVITDPEPLRGFDIDCGPHVFVSVSDTGIGIADAQLPHIFEPFFTTKDIGMGSGLGLATVYGIVRQHKGWIDVATTPGRGATFCFYLPTTTAHELADEMRAADDKHLSHGNETLLVVEDEPALRELVVGVLEKCGYAVVAASSGADALAKWSAVRDRVQLMLTDLVMPGGITGKELAERLRVDKPELRIVYMSGFAASQGASGEPFLEGINFLPKPYAPDALAKIVRGALDTK